MKILTELEIYYGLRIYGKMKRSWPLISFIDWLKIWYRGRKIWKVKAHNEENN